MSDTTTHSQDPHDPTVDAINLLRTAGVINDSRHAEKQAAQAASWIARWSETPENVDPKAWAAGLRRLATLMFKPDEPLVDLIQRMSHVAGEPSGDTFLVNDLLGVMQPLTRSDVKEIVKEALADFDPLAADVDAILRGRGVEVKPGESPYLALLRSIPVNAESGGKRADEWRRKSAVANHLMGVSFSPDEATRNAALHLAEALPILDLELTDRAKDPSQCSVDDLGVRLASTDHVVQTLDRVTSDDSPVRQVVRNLLHNSSPSVVDAGAHSVGDGPGAGDASATPATEVTAESLVEAVRDARVDQSAAYRVRRDAKANLDEADDNLAYAKNQADTARSALYDFINRGIK